MKYLIIFVSLFALTCCAQSETSSDKLVGGPFQNRDLFYEGIPSSIYSADTSESWFTSTEKIVIRGRIYKPDGRTPVPEVLLYYYQTDSSGKYSGSTIHGDIRGWIKSDQDGNYSLYSSKPGAYPNRSEPAHIHFSILESEIGYPYYIDAFVFDDDPLLTSSKRKEMQNRGGSGVLRGSFEDGRWVAEHNIIVGLNIPDHPDNQILDESGKSIGEDLESFAPRHIWGADRGTNVCPVCKYGKTHGIIFYVGSEMTKSELVKWLLFLEGQCSNAELTQKVFVVAHDHTTTDLSIFDLVESLDLENLAICIGEEKDFQSNEVDLVMKSTIFLYRRSNIYDKFIDLTPSDENLEMIKSSLKF